MKRTIPLSKRRVVLEFRNVLPYPKAPVKGLHTVKKLLWGCSTTDRVILCRGHRAVPVNTRLETLRTTRSQECSCCTAPAQMVGCSLDTLGLRCDESQSHSMT